MKFLVFSDNHGDIESIDRIISFYPNNDGVFSLGDSCLEEFELDNRRILGVRGNYYFEPNLPYSFLRKMGNFHVYFTHGHLEKVKFSMHQLFYKCLERGANICFYGHTHVAKIEEINDIIFVNPGSTYLPIYPKEPTFAYVEINENNLKIEM